MGKFEYSDFYKFIASAGVALIALAFIIPWLFLREPFDLLQKQGEILLLTPLAQSIIQERQVAVQIIFILTPIFSCLLCGLGLFLLVAGSLMWHKRTQTFLDKFNELNVKALEKQLKTSSPEQVKSQQEEEIKEQFDIEDVEKNHGANIELDEILQPDRLSSIVQAAFRVERRLSEYLVSCFGDTHTILPERRLRDISFDIVMASKLKSVPDYIFEVKYVQRGFKYYWLRDNALKLIYANQSYVQETGREASPILFIVGNNNMLKPSSSDVENYIHRLKNEIYDLDAKVKILFMSESEFNIIDCAHLKSKINR